MRRLLFAFLWVLLFTGISFAQNTTALAPQALPGLNVQVRGGTILLANSSIGISNTTVALSNNTTNYVFLSSAGVVQTNTTGFTSTMLPIATVITAQGQIVDIQDNRPDYIFAGGGSGLPAGPTTPNGVGFGLTSTPVGGVAGTAAWSWPGVGLTAQTGTTYTFLAGDRSTGVTSSNAAAQTYTLPDAGTTNFAFNYNVGLFNNLATGNTVTLTRTSASTINGATTLAVPFPSAAYIYTDPNNNWRVINTALWSPGITGLNSVGSGFGIQGFNPSVNIMSSAANDIQLQTNGTADGVEFKQTNLFGTTDEFQEVWVGGSGGWGIIDVAGSGNTPQGMAFSTGAAIPISVRPNRVETARFLSGGGIEAIGGAATITGTGACATITTQVGGTWGGSFKCTGTAGASTITIVPGSTAVNGWTCNVYDETTRADNPGQTSHNTTQCIVTSTTTAQNDVFSWSATAY